MILLIFHLSSMFFCGLASFALGRMSKGGALGLELARAVRQRDAMEALANKYLETQCTAIEQVKVQQGRAERAEYDLNRVVESAKAALGHCRSCGKRLALQDLGYWSCAVAQHEQATTNPVSYYSSDSILDATEIE